MPLSHNCYHSEFGHSRSGPDDVVDDVALLAEMLEVLVLAMAIMQEEAAVLVFR